MHNMYNENIVLGKNGQPIHSRIAIHPGEVLRDEIEARGLIKKEFAAKIELLPQHLSELFAGKRHFTAVLAIKLEEVLDIDAEFWLQLQNEYDLTIERNKKIAKGKPAAKRLR
ncbi:HigA family addiction module antitoxin [Chitinophaga sp. GbtcB8]|uniref:HigA family addiction module antitoxin n=1 Tax=Chitinophaga sp. GbtcB8 TaxID=2824753 RepID=UPI001C2F4E4E|nr:HigA family addiction module antitoxin [Chitinophaga sp. GbtcB8]